MSDSEVKISIFADASELEEASSESSAAAEQINQSLLPEPTSWEIPDRQLRQ